jgi:trypsin
VSRRMRFYVRTKTCALVLAAILALGITVAPGLRAQDEIKTFGRRIIGGEPTDIKEHPWQVAFNIKKASGIYLCGGSIIAAKWVLSARHCFVNPPTDARFVKFKAGSTNIFEGGLWTEIEKIELHEAYDVALVKLKTVPAGRIIPLMPASAILQPGQPLEVTGWGVTEEERTSEEVLKKATVPYVDNAKCNEADAYNNRILPHEMCAGRREGGIDSCQGDSGGPLVWHTINGPILVGVVSWGDNCALKMKYGVYVRVSAIRDWIDQVVGADRN